MWTARLVLETQSHVYPGTFFTLTYSPDHLPDDGSLDPDHLESFRYKLRYRLGPFRYYFVGEYGERTFRPHYHGLIFGIPLTPKHLATAWEYCDWRHIHTGTITVHSAAYMAGYVTKKLTNKEDERLEGRHPEFARMSRKPGLGARGLHAIQAWLWSDQGADYVATHGDVPPVIRFEGKIYPLGRYLVSRLRADVGVEEDNPQRQALRTARALDAAVPEIAFLREQKRENEYWRAQAHVRLKRSLEKL